tara:strand:- start:235 stop:432 length:198 start_codon:yes stop_codon:yes gene_type:complete
LVSVPLDAKTVLGTRANWNKLIELDSDLVEVVSDRENRDHPMTPMMILTGYSGSDEPTKMVNINV